MYYFLLGLIFYSFFVSIITKKNRVLSELLGILILTFITFMIGLRYGVGIDYFSYESAFNTRYDSFSYEPLYSLLMFIIKTNFNKFYYLTFILIFITNFFIYLGLKKRNVRGLYALLAIYIYISNTAFIFTNLMRQGVAIAIFFYASTFIKERNFKKFIFYVLIGAGFHLSILLLLPMYLITKIRFSKWSYFLTIVFSYIIVYSDLTKNIFNFIVLRLPKYSRYYNYPNLFNENINLLSMGVILNIILIFILLIILKDKKCNEYILEKNYYMIGTLINILALSSYMFDRIGIYFFTFGLAVIPKSIENVDNKWLRRFCFLLSILIATLFFVVNSFINAEALSLNYKSIFQLS